jgi:CDP-diacylglycerol--glycerol-3-phosphate 3-phosphatidyltransferase
MVRFMRGLPTPNYNESPARGAPPDVGPHAGRTFTGIIGTACNYPLRGIIAACVKLHISPNVLTFVGVVINITAAVLLGVGAFWTAGFTMVVANIFDFIDGKVARARDWETPFGGFWDSVMDRFSDISLFVGLIYLYSQFHRTDYVMITALAMMFSVLTSYTRARAESIVDKCKVGFLERPERIVLFMIGAFTNRMAAVMWVVLVLSIFTVADRMYFTWRELSGGKRSLDDFARGFFGGKDGWGEPVTYTFEDVVAALQAIAPFDWARWFRDRLDSHAPGASG